MQLPPSLPLIAAASIQQLLREWQGDIGRLSRLYSEASRPSDLQLYMRLTKELTAALEEARSTEVFGSVEDAARIAKRPVSTVRRWCARYEASCGASREGGVWRINLPVFARFMDSVIDADGLEGVQ